MSKICVTYEECQLMALYRPENRKEAIRELTEMRQYLSPEARDLLTLTDSALEKLRRMTDSQFDELELAPDGDEE